MFRHKCTFPCGPYGVQVYLSWVVSRCEFFFEAIQDLRNLLKVKRPESQMVKVVVYVSSALLTKCLALVQLGSCKAQQIFVNKFKIKEKLGHCNIILEWGERAEHNGDEFISTHNYSGSFVFLDISWVFLLEISSKIADAFIVYWTTGHPDFVRLFSCSECVSWTVYTMSQRVLPLCILIMNIRSRAMFVCLPLRHYVSSPCSMSIRFSCNAIVNDSDDVFFRFRCVNCETLHVWCKHGLQIDS